MSKRKRRPRLAGGPRPAGRAGSAIGSAPWLYGTHAVRAALANPARSCRRLLATAETARALAPLPETAPDPEIVSRDELARRLPAGAVHQGLALLADDLPPADLASACAPGAEGRDVVLALDRVTDPRNVGAILRAAAAFGARAVIVTRRHAPEATGALAKAASGALETVPLVRVVNLARALDDLGTMGYWRLGLDPAAPETLAAVKPTGPVALVLGAEGAGLRRLTGTKCDLAARLAVAPGVQSLNVAAAAAVALYELARDSTEG